MQLLRMLLTSGLVATAVALPVAQQPGSVAKNDDGSQHGHQSE